MEETETKQEEIVGEQLKAGLLDKLKIYKFKILGGILGVLVFSGAVFGAYKLGQKSIYPEPAEGPTPTPVATPTPEPTANWKTYTNTKYGYSIKYPPDWSFEEETKESIHFSPKENEGYILIRIFSSANRGVSICELDRSRCNFVIDNKIFGERTKNAITDAVFLPGMPRGGVDMSVILYKREKDYTSTFNLMLSTFKFLPSVDSGQGEKVFCKEPRPEVCTMECIVNPPYICGSNGKSYCNVCGACADLGAEWYIIQDIPCKP